MRPLEIILLLAEFATFGLLAIADRHVSAWRLALASVALLLACAQALFEGWRWQMTPADALAGILLWMAWLARASRPVRPTHWRRIIRMVAFGVGGLALLFAAALPMLVPVFAFPAPTGPYAIGTATYHWVDEARGEPFTAAPDDHRELMVQIWYPAQRLPGAVRAPYTPDVDFRQASRELGLPPFFLSHLKYVRTHAQPSAPAAEGGRFPVLLFSPGLGGYRGNNTYQIEELVSHGYAVVGIDHPYTVADVAFPDGRHVALDPRAISEDRHDAGSPGYVFATETIYPLIGQDAVFVLDRVSALNQDDPQHILRGRLDLDGVGMFGSSLGGIATAEACRMDARIRACLVLDAAMPPDVVASGLRQAVMWISREPESTRQDEGWKPSAVADLRESMRSVFDRLPGDGYQVFIPGMFHPDISDLPYLLPPPAATALHTTGPRDFRDTHAVINAYSRAFFDAELKGESEALAVPLPPFADVRLVRRR